MDDMSKARIVVVISVLFGYSSFYKVVFIRIFREKKICE